MVGEEGMVPMKIAAATGGVGPKTGMAGIADTVLMTLSYRQRGSRQGNDR